jgi:hypothetical protein
MEKEQEFLDAIQEKHGVTLTATEAEQIFDEVAKEITFGSSEIEEKLVRMLMALHSLDDDTECNEFYYDVQEAYDDLQLQEGFEPIKDRVFANCMANLINSGHVEELKTLNYNTKKVIKGYRINSDFKVLMNNTTLQKLSEFKAKKLFC